MHPMLSMAHYLRDFHSSKEQGRNIFRLPYPGGNWREEKQNNSQLLTLMDSAWSVAVLSAKVSEGIKLSKQENKLLDVISELLE